MTTNAHPSTKLLLIAIAVAAIIVLSSIILKRQSERPQVTKFTIPEVVSVPPVVFDANTSIPGTTVTIAYPSSGFYGHGVKTVFDSADTDTAIPSLGGFTLLPDIDPKLDRPEMLSVLVVPNSGNLHEAIALGRVNGLPVGDHSSDGTFMMLNGHEFFVYKTLESATLSAWHAISFGKRETILVTFEYVANDDARWFTAARKDDSAFFQILSHLTFE